MKNEDLSSLIDYLDEKFSRDEEFKDLKKDFRVLQSAVDDYVTKANAYFQEMVMFSHRMDRHREMDQTNCQTSEHSLGRLAIAKIGAQIGISMTEKFKRCLE